MMMMCVCVCDLLLSTVVLVYPQKLQLCADTAYCLEELPRANRDGWQESVIGIHVVNTL